MSGFQEEQAEHRAREEQARRYEYAVWKETSELYKGMTPREAMEADRYHAQLVRAKRAKREQSEGWEKYEPFLQRAEGWDKCHADRKRAREQTKGPKDGAC